IYFVYVALGPNGPRQAVRAIAFGVPVAAVVLVTPLGDRILANLPFVGTVATGAVTYRQELAGRSWELVQQNLLFGDAFALLQLEDLRQGEGIIDLVNTYASIALFYGLVGLTLFLAPLALALLRARRAAARSGDAEFKQLGAALIACAIGTLVMMGAGSFGGA